MPRTDGKNNWHHPDKYGIILLLGLNSPPLAALRLPEKARHPRKVGDPVKIIDTSIEAAMSYFPLRRGNSLRSLNSSLQI